MTRMDQTQANTAAVTRGGAGSGPGADAPDPFAGRTLSHYRLEHRLGAGGMGAVYLAHDHALNRPAAIKLLPPDFPADLRERLVREGQMSARLQHPGIATFYEAGRADGLDFIAMEYVPGRTLRERILEGPLPPDEAVTITSGMLEALAHAHASGLIHRDIKPANVMIAQNGSPRLLDLGLARALWAEDDGSAPTPDRHEPTDGLGALDSDSALTREIGPIQAQRLTQTGSVLGTIGYMAPEQLYGTAVDERADVFATGAVLFEMLTGRPAFVGRTLAESFAMVVHRDLEWPEGHDTPAVLRAIVHRAVARRIEERFPSASAFLAELRPLEPRRRRSGALRIAVLPFENRTADPEWDWLGNAVAKEIGRRFAVMEGLALVPEMAIHAAARTGSGKTGSERDIAIGQQLACWATLSGELERTIDGHLILGMRLVDVAACHVTCRDRWTGSLDGVAVAHDRFASTAGAALGLDVALPGVARPSAEAFACFGRGRSLLYSGERALLEEGVRLLERSVELQPDYAAALAALAGSYALRSNAMADTSLADLALDRAERALAVDPGLAEAHLWRGYTLIQKERFVEAIPSLRRAMELDPANPQVPYFASGATAMPTSRDEARGAIVAAGGPGTVEEPYRWLLDKGMELAQTSLRLNPRFAWAWAMLGAHQMGLRQFADARWSLGRARDLEPTAFPPLWGSVGFLGECHRLEGDLVEARRLLIEGIETVEKRDHMYRDTFRGLFLHRLGLTARGQGDVEGACAALTQAIQHLRGRPGARAGGHVLVQSLAGLAASTGDPTLFDEALDLFHRRVPFSFSWLWLCHDSTDLWALAQAARALGRPGQAESLEERSLDAGYRWA